ncbi:MAG: tetratricopeptide repeat protein, partial [Planctomycetes bacterium]|nr:tetratricopeptide repeat protein [Planctomycetota bacterium]
VGDVIEVKWSVRGRNPEYFGHFCTRYAFGADEYPVVRDEFRVRLPVSRTFRHAVVGGRVEPQVSERDGFRLYRWGGDNFRQLSKDEDRPSVEESRLRVACSTFASWDEVAAWKRRLRANCWECTKEIKQVVEEVTKGLKGPAEKARALTYWVRRNVRYLSTGEKHLYTPHRPAEVLANRLGDCKDTSQLLAVMLKHAGLEASLVTLGTRDDGQVLEAVPSPWGTHGILLLTIEGKEHWVDTTATLSGWDFLPRSSRDRLCYVLDNKRIYLKRTPRLTPDDNGIEQTTEVTIAADGSSLSRRTSVYRGLSATTQRDRWLEVPAGEQRRLAAARLLDSNSQTRLNRLDLDESALRHFDEPVRVRTTFTIPGQFAGKDRDGSFSDSEVWSHLLAYNLDYDRHVPMELHTPLDARHRFIVRAPAGSEFDGKPKAKTVRSKWGTFTRATQFVDNGFRTVQVDFQLRLEKMRVEPADFETFRAFHRDVADCYRAWLTLETVYKLSHAAELEAILWAVPSDSASSATLARLYLHHGLGEDARRVLRRARVYRPDDVALWELSVKAAGNRDEAERLQREIVRRFPNDPTQAITLAAMLIDRDKYNLGEPLLRLIVETSPAARALASYHLARAAFRQGHAEQALKHLDEAEQYTDSKDHTLAVEMLRGRVCEKLKKYGDAVRAYEKAHKTDPKAADALIALIEVSLARKDVTQGASYLRRYIVLVNDDFDGLLRSADFALRLGRLDEAYDLALRARDLRFHEGVQRILGLVALRRGEYDKAAFHLERADATAPVLLKRIQTQLALGNLTAAEREAKRGDLLVTVPADLKASLERVRTLVTRRETLLKQSVPKASDRNRWITAIEYLVCAEEARREGNPARVEWLLAKAEAEGRDLGSVRGLRAVLLLERGRLTQALVEAERAIVLSPEEASGWYVRGRVRLERAAAGTLPDLHKAAGLSGRKDADILQALAEAQFQGGQAEQGRQTLREVLKLRPSDKALGE